MTRKPSKKSTASVITDKYRDAYAANGSCDDDVAKRLRTHAVDKDGKLDLVKLKALAERNGVWRDTYAKLNPGMQRMNVSNRLRSLDKVVWK